MVADPGGIWSAFLAGFAPPCCAESNFGQARCHRSGQHHHGHCAPRRYWSVPARDRDGDSGLYRYHYQPGNGIDFRSALPGRPDCASRRAADRDRPAPLSGPTARGTGSAGARHESAGAGPDGRAALSRCLGAQRHRQAEIGRPGKDRASIRRHGQSRSGHGAVRPGAGRVLPT